jgi:hypothetical protein
VRKSIFLATDHPKRIADSELPNPKPLPDTRRGDQNQKIDASVAEQSAAAEVHYFHFFARKFVPKKPPLKNYQTASTPSALNDTSNEVLGSESIFKLQSPHLFPSSAKFIILARRSGNSIPAIFAQRGKREVAVIPGTVLASRTTIRSGVTIISTRAKPRHPRVL